MLALGLEQDGQYGKDKLLFSRSVVSSSLQPHGLQHSRLPCPSPSPGVCSNSSIVSMMPSNHLILCHSRLFLPSIFPSIRVFSNESGLFASRGQSIGALASASVPPMNSQDWFSLGLTHLISLQSKERTRRFSIYLVGDRYQERETWRLVLRFSQVNKRMLVWTDCRGPEHGKYSQFQGKVMAGLDCRIWNKWRVFRGGVQFYTRTWCLQEG